ncbi:uncharacterized protein BDW47DRAFT_58298 [Aspergillus candidus]|uniref:Uncharacterized protein n=1 Tax=Aspergillus candidus TaxID=41067 RepID=A0A2I2F5F4_ASPCN|nr:hypothetical protein BDW47DRAFT_58298 [Aspergillus candidus]PLB35854.1 hypothetical protein BDW47DRAFT_58298 [Aspergillus candidus]
MSTGSRDLSLLSSLSALLFDFIFLSFFHSILLPPSFSPSICKSSDEIRSTFTGPKLIKVHPLLPHPTRLITIDNLPNWLSPAPPHHHLLDFSWFLFLICLSLSFSRSSFLVDVLIPPPSLSTNTFKLTTDHSNSHRDIKIEQSV